MTSTNTQGTIWKIWSSIFSNFHRPPAQQIFAGPASWVKRAIFWQWSSLQGGAQSEAIFNVKNFQGFRNSRWSSKQRMVQTSQMCDVALAFYQRWNRVQSNTKSMIGGDLAYAKGQSELRKSWSSIFWKKTELQFLQNSCWGLLHHEGCRTITIAAWDFLFGSTEAV